MRGLACPLGLERCGCGEDAVLMGSAGMHPQDSVGIAHAQVCGCAAAGEALLDAAYLSLVSNLGESAAG